MTDERFERMLRKAMPQMEPGEELNERLLGEMEGKRKAKFCSKRVVVLAVACMLMLSSLTVAASTIYYSVTRTKDFHTKDYRKIDYAEEKLGCDIKFVRSFASGFSFERMDILNDTVCAMEESGEVAFTEEHASVVIWYAGDKGDLMLICSKAAGASVETDDSNVREVAGVRVRYEESLAPDGIEKMSAQWIQDGVYYFLGALPDASTEKELLSVVEELILSE